MYARIAPTTYAGVSWGYTLLSLTWTDKRRSTKSSEGIKPLSIELWSSWRYRYRSRWQILQSGISGYQGWSGVEVHAD